MAVIDFSRSVDLVAEQAWARVTAFGEHGRFVPLTSVTLIDATAPGGGGFIARTAIGPIGFDDVNVLERWEPPTDSSPGVAQLRKTGRLVHGGARITVTAKADGGSVIRWEEWISITAVPRLADPLLARAGSLMFGRVVSGLVATT